MADDLELPRQETLTSPTGQQPFPSAEDAQRFILQTVYDRFRETGDWPRARDLDLDYSDVLLPFGGLEVLCRQMGVERISCGSPAAEHDRVILSLRAITECNGAEEDLRNFLAIVRFGADTYHTKRGNEARVSTQDLTASLGLTDVAARRALEMLGQADSLTQGGSPDTKTLAHAISRFRGVQTLEDYLVRAEAEAERRRTVAQLGVSRVKPRPPHPPKRIFLSHAADDAAVAHHVADVIRQGSPGTKVFVASKAGDIPTGSDWLGAIEAELKQADTYLLLLTPHSVKRLWLWYESGAAWMSGRALVPVTAAGLAKADVLYPLGARQALSLEDPADVAQLGRDLGTTISDPERFCETVRDLCESLPWRTPKPRTHGQRSA